MDPKRPRSKSVRRTPSDDETFCEMFFKLSLEEVVAKNIRLKADIARLINNMNRSECLKITHIVLRDFDVKECSQGYLTQTSPRFQELINSSDSPRKSSKHLRQRSKSIDSTKIIQIPKTNEEDLSEDQINRDLLRLRAHLNMISANMNISDNLNFINKILDTYPHLKDINAKNLLITSPRGHRVVSNTFGGS